MDSVGKKNRYTKNPLHHIGVSSYPPFRVAQHNSYTRSFRGKVKKTSRGCPNWVLRMVIGPFRKNSHKFAGAWKSACRRHVSKTAVGLLLAHLSHRNVVCDNARQICEQAQQEFQGKTDKYRAVAKRFEQTVLKA